MSRGSDADQLIKRARKLGFGVEKLKHGGYAVTDGARRVTTIPDEGHGKRGWVKRVQRELGLVMTHDPEPTIDDRCPKRVSPPPTPQGMDLESVAMHPRYRHLLEPGAQCELDAGHADERHKAGLIRWFDPPVLFVGGVKIT